jgi:hypothetical protein
MKKKNTLRIGSLILILMFLILPILSSPVAASLTVGLGSVWTNNWPPPPGLGPTAGGTIVSPASPVGPDPGPFNIRFSVSYTYTDSYPGGMGSNHWMSITGSYQPGGMGAWVPFTFTQTVVTLGPSGTATGTYRTPYIIGYGGPGTNFNLNVIVNCQDVSTTTTFTWTSGAVTFTTS